MLACGVDRAYPAAHTTLLDYIAERGLVVSELPPGCSPTRLRFLSRNRVIAALAQGTVVVEAAVRSGALNTANWAARLNRVVMGVPGPVTSAPSEGVHQLIRTRDAALVTSGADVLELLAPARSFLAPEARGPETVRDRLPERDRQVLEAVPVSQGRAPTRSPGPPVSPPATSPSALDRLQGVGLVERSGEVWRLLR